MITADDPRWSESYPCLLEPLPGEALPGYLLRLDAENQLDAGFTWRSARRTTAGPGAAARPSNWVCGTTLDLGAIADISGRSREQIALLTYLPLLRWLYAERFRDSLLRRHLVMARRTFALCPLCAERRFVSAASLLKVVTGCPEHGLQLQEVCGCGQGVRLFTGGEPWTCQNIRCGRSYKYLGRVPLSDGERDRAARLEACLVALRAVAMEPDRPSVRGTALATSLRSIARQSADLILRERLLRVIGQCPPLHVILEVLTSLSVDPREWVGHLARPCATPRTRRRSAGAQAFFSEEHPSCPVCAGSALYARGRPVGLRGDMEYLCKTCGARFTRSRVLFSFEPHPLYPLWRQEANVHRLARVREAVNGICSALLAARLPIRVDAVLREAKVEFNLPYRSSRPGLIATIRAAQALQKTKVRARTSHQTRRVRKRSRYGRS